MSDNELLLAISDLIDKKLKFEFQSEIQPLKDDMRALKDNLRDLKYQVTNIELHLENITDKNIQLLAENWHNL